VIYEFARDRVDATIIAERVEYLDEHGKLVTESLRDFTKKALKEALRQPQRCPHALEGGGPQAGDRRGTGSRGPAARPDRRGIGQEPRSVRHVAFDRKPLTRRERAENVKKRDVFTNYEG
jgi:type I restriction enzyme R subunit